MDLLIRVAHVTEDKRGLVAGWPSTEWADVERRGVSRAWNMPNVARHLSAGGGPVFFDRHRGG